jgi:hypothetical protein
MTYLELVSRGFSPLEISACEWAERLLSQGY